jgi:metal-responsive CopG/Arc/MetJ family transcriptional regulator
MPSVNGDFRKAIEMNRKFKQVNVNITDEDNEKLVKMMRLEGFDNRSAFIRKLIRDEYKRKHAQETKETD